MVSPGKQSLVVLVGLAVLAGLHLPSKLHSGEHDKTFPQAVLALEQGWTSEQTQWWYYLSQGTVFMPYQWFRALEQADGAELFSSPGHMTRLGFLTDPPHSRYNPDGLPVGFAKKSLDFDNEPYSCWKGEWIGFGCAACHTGQVNYRGYQIRIDGGPAHHDIEAFQTSLAKSLDALAASDEKLSRFSQRVLQSIPGMTVDDLVKSFACYARALRANKSFLEAAQAQAAELPTPSGFARLDAHERGVNLFLAVPLKEPRNYIPETAPVSFPAIWDTPYFDWVLYNAAIRQPLARNVIEALGVQAPIDHRTLFSDAQILHSVDMANVAAGQRAVMNLISPRWPEEILGRLDKEKVAQGATLYRQHCSSCHELIDRITHSGTRTPSSTADHRISVAVIPQLKIGTDPRQALTFARRTVDLSKIGGPSQISSFEAGQYVTEKIVTDWIAQSPENKQRAAEVNYNRPNEFRALIQYRARPLNGIWATAPYLHNGSVGSLFELLRPAETRAKVLYIGNWDFDPIRVGYEVSSPFPGATILDTRLPGNSNAGHEFATELNSQERAALIEYLKSL